MLPVRLNAICSAAIFGFVLMNVCMADNINTACETALTEDKPPCVQVTWYVLEADGSNVLKATLAYFGKTTTNANNEVVNKIKLPPRIMNGLSAAPFWAPNGEEIILNQKTDIEDLGPAILASLQRSHLPNAIAGVSPARQRPNIYIESPNQSILTQPIIDVKGISDQPLLGVSYDVLNDLQTLTNQHGFVTDDFFDNQQLRFTTNWFSCFDINLAPGTNAVFVHGYYPNGRLTIKKIYVLRLDLKTNAPTFQINWPSLDQQISGEEFTLRGNTDDDNATVTGEITDGNQSKVIKGEVERGGRFWLEHVPLFSKTNHIKISVTDVVGNSSVTNLTIVKSEDIIIINHIPPRQLLQMQVMVTGKISPPNRNVWVNGLKANVQTNGECPFRLAGVMGKAIARRRVTVPSNPEGAPSASD